MRGQAPQPGPTDPLNITLPRIPPSARPVASNVKAHTLFASLNINGLRSRSGARKFDQVWQLMRERRIGILAIQEAHLSSEQADALSGHYKRLRFLVSPTPNHASSMGGVAFVLNKDVVDASDDNISFNVIVPGRAATLDIGWHTTRRVSILNIYAPSNNPADKRSFYTSLYDSWIDRERFAPDVMLGDFNIVEASLDRFPPHTDDAAAVHALSRLITLFRLEDGYRRTFPTSPAFTFERNSAEGLTSARLDRVYVSDEILRSSHSWNIHESPIESDHKLVSFTMVDEQLPFIGRGRYALPDRALNDEVFLREVEKLGSDALTAMRAIDPVSRSRTNNAPLIWKRDFKDKVMRLARSRMKTTFRHSTEGRLQNLYAQRDSVLKEATHLGASLDGLALAEINSRIRSLEATAFANRRLAVEARDRVEGGRPGKYFSAIHNPKAPRDVVFRLRSPAPTPGRSPHVTKSSEMAELARNYHESRQSVAPCPPPATTRQRTARLEPFIERRLSEEQKAKLDTAITPDSLSNVLHKAKSASAPGLDGLGYAFYKTLVSRFEAAPPVPTNHSPSFDVLAALALVHNDIASHSPDDYCPEANFAEAWMALLFKKGERDRTENYRPISCLNCDYKLLEAERALRLCDVIGSIIQPDQAGFVPGRSIFDQTQLVRLVLEMADAYDIQGSIIALDQEKAYDRILHPYLLDVLRMYNLPESFVNLVQVLYTGASTKVMINGVLSSPFDVTRGVRQGGPLSCLLFIIAIEPLASMLRLSDLKGVTVHNSTRRLIASLFADDTTVFLDATDRLDDLFTILDSWCLASGAKFNISKTCIIPLGSPDHRTTVLESRRLHPDHDPVPANIPILRDRDHTRVLGAFVGNDIREDLPWGPLVSKARAFFAKYANHIAYPDLQSRTNLVSLYIGQTTQYLTRRSRP
ncbi:unnamed protein product [Peniophora sp. CBMAI 1063]|nr:unnamed protein product [Peniophora sp. CBMAI 1063]